MLVAGFVPVHIESLAGAPVLALQTTVRVAVPIQEQAETDVITQL
jgi:hypothetical protein